MNENRQEDDDDDESIASTKEPSERRPLKSLFSSHVSSLDDSSWTESAERHVLHHPTPQQLRADDQRRPSASGIVVDTDRSDDLSAPKHRKRVLPDVSPQDAEADTGPAPTVERLAEFPRWGKIHRRQDGHKRRRVRYHRRTRKHRHPGIRRGRVTSTFPRSAGSRSAHLPIDVAIRMLGSRPHRSRHRRHRRRPKARVRQAQAPWMSGVLVDNGRQRPRRDRRDLSRVTHVSRQNRTLSGQHPSTTLSDSVTSTTPPPADATNAESANSALVYYRMRRSSSFAHSRLPRDMDAQRQRLILEKLIEASMSDAERASRNLASSRLDQLLGKINGTGIDMQHHRVHR